MLRFYNKLINLSKYGSGTVCFNFLFLLEQLILTLKLYSEGLKLFAIAGLESSSRT